jgi:hypothetical protein
MVREFQAVLDSLPGKPAVSLEEYRELIGEMRRRGLTYREIAGVLADKFQVKADLGAIHDMLRGAVRRRRPPAPRARARAEAAPVAPQVPQAPQAPQAEAVQVARTMAAARTIPAARTQVRKEAGRPVFEYDENEPLRLIGNSKSIE